MHPFLQFLLILLLVLLIVLSYFYYVGSSYKFSVKTSSANLSPKSPSSQAPSMKESVAVSSPVKM